MFSLGGVAHYLFQPLAEAVIFAMLASYILSRTLVSNACDVPSQTSGRKSRSLAQSLYAGAEGVRTAGLRLFAWPTSGC